MPIQQFKAPESPIAAIGKALEVAQSIYGIKQAAAASDYMKQKMGNEETTFQQGQAANQAALDPNSQAAQAAQMDKVAQIDAYKKHGYLDPKTADKLESMVQGSPATPDVPVEGPTQDNSVIKIPGSAAKPGLSIAALKSVLPEESGLGAFVSGQQKADIANNKNELYAMLAGVRNQNMQTKNQVGVNKEYKQELGGIENTIQSANRVDNIINQVKGQTDPNDPNNVVIGKQLKADLSNQLAGMFANGKITVSGADHQNFDSAYSRLQAAKDFIGGTTSNSIPAAQLNQLQNDIGAVRGEYGKQHENTFNAFLAGTPDQLQPKLQDRYDTFRKSSGLDPSPDKGGAGIPGVASVQAGVKDPNISNYAQQHGLDYGTATTLLKSRGYNGQ